MKAFKRLVLIFGMVAALHARATDGGAAAHYTGTVTDDKGQPVPGATVDCYQDPAAASAFSAQNFTLKEHGTTDSKGGFSVSAGAGVTLVVAKKEGLAPGWKVFASASGETNAPVVLRARAALAGLVVDGEGQPVADAEVWVSRAMPVTEARGAAAQTGSLIAGKAARDCFSTRTSEDGHFRIPNFPAGAQADLAARKAGVGQRVRVNFAGTLAYSSGTEALKLTLSAPGSIEGKVTAEGTGQPLAGVKLRWLGWMGGLSESDSPEPVLSGADGRFRIADAASGKAMLRAEFPGVPVGDWVAEDVMVTVASGATNKEVRIQAEKGGVAVVTVLSQRDQQPVGGATIRATGQTTQSTFLAETGPDGVGWLRLPVGDIAPGTIWVFTAAKEGWEIAGGNYATSVRKNQTNSEELQIRPSVKITGIVRDPTGKPVAGVVMSMGQNFANAPEVTTDANGRYEMKLQNNGMFFNVGMRVSSGWGGGTQTYTILARSAERNLIAQRSFDETTTNVDLKLQPAVTLLLRVQDARGAPLANATGNAYSLNENGGYGGQNNQASISDAQGRMEFSGLVPADGYSVNVSAKGYGSASEQVEAPGRQTNRIVVPPIVLAPANQKLAGTVLGPDGKPLSGANVSFSGEGQPNGNTTSDADGHFSFDAVCEGTVQLNANSQGGGGMNFMNANTQAKGGDTNVVIQFAVNGQGGNGRILTVSGRVLDASGKPVSGAAVSVGPAFGQTIEVRSDEDGKYSLTWAKQNFGGQQAPFIYVRDMEHHLAASRDLDETETNMDFKLQEALTLSVKVQDANGKPVSAATANMMIWSGNNSSSFGQNAGRADEQGVIEIKDLLPERHYSLTITAGGFGTTSIQAQAGETKTNRFDFPILTLKAADQKLAGQVLGPDGKPVARANVNLQGEGQPNCSTNTDAQGRFVFNAVCDGPVHLFANSQSGYMYANVQARGGDTNVVIQFAANGQGGMNAQMVTTTGKVLDANGAPVSGMRVSVAPNNGRNMDVRSDDDGKYSITWQKQPNSRGDRPPFIYVRDVEQNLSASHDLDELMTNVDLRLEPGLTLSVKVQDSQGKPVGSASARLTAWAGNMGFNFSQMAARADEEGLIEIKALPQARQYTVNLSANGYGSASLEAKAGETKTTRFEFPKAVLKATDRKLAGQVLGPDGKPMSGFNVNYSGEGQPSGNTTTDASGHFAFVSVCEGPVRLNASGQSDYGNYMYANAEAQGGDTNVVIQFTVNGQNGGPNQQTLKTSGTVLDASGAPVAGARLSVAPGNGNNMEFRSGADGKFSIFWMKQNFGGGQPAFIYARDLQHHLAASHDLDETTTNLELKLQEALALSIKVQDAKGKAISAATGNLTLWAGNYGFNFSPLPASADNQGVIEIKDLLPEQHYTLTISAKGYGSATLQAQATETKTNRFDFPPVVLKSADLKLAGHVLGPDSKPVAGANVNFSGEGQPGGNTTTDAKGRFVFDSASEGTVQLNASGQGANGNYLSGNAQARGGDTNVVIWFGINGMNNPNAQLVTTSGRVLDANGAPVSGARLSVFSANFGMDNEIRSEADGKYSITWQMPQRGAQTPPFLLVRDLEHHLTASHDLDETTTNLDLKLEEALTLSAKVRDEKGGPISTATGTLTIYSGNTPRTDGQTQVSADNQGILEIKDLAQGRHYSVGIAAKGYGTARLQAQVTETKTNHFEFPPVVLKAASLKLTGQVLGPDGKPVAGANVTLQGGEGQPGGFMATDASGYFAFDAVCEGAVRLFANSQGPGANMSGNVQAQGGDTNVVIQFAANGQGGGPNTRIIRTTGKVLDASGAPVAGARLEVWPVNGNTEIKSDAEGKYSIAWRSPGNGQRPFLYACDAEHHQAASRDLDETTTNLDLRLQEGLTLSVKVQDTNGKPIPTATETLNVASGTWTFYVTQTPANANSRGVIEIKDLPQDRHYSAWITARGYGTARPEAKAGETRTNHFDFPVAVLKAADRKLAGQVLGPDSKPVSGAMVFIQVDDGQPSVNATTDGQGRFVLDPVCEGPIHVYANTQGAGPSMSGNAQAQGGDTNVVLRFGINSLNNPGAQVVTTSGKVLDPSGAPLSGVRLMIIPGNGPFAEVKSDAEGKYSITWQFRIPSPRAGTAGATRRGSITPAAPIHLLVGRDGERQLAAAVEVDDKTTNVDLHLEKGLTISGSVLDAAGAPVKDPVISVSMFAGTGSAPLDPQQELKGDVKGAFIIGPLPQGQRYSLFARASGYGSTNQQVEATDTQTNSLQLPPFVLKVADQKVEGQVLDAAGKPATGARVNVTGNGQPAGASATTDSNGHFLIEHVCEGAIRVSASLQSDAARVPPVTGNTQAQAGDVNVVVKLGAPQG